MTPEIVDSNAHSRKQWYYCMGIVQFGNSRLLTFVPIVYIGLISAKNTARLTLTQGNTLLLLKIQKWSVTFVSPPGDETCRKCS